VRDPKERLRDVLDAIAAIERYLGRGKPAFEQAASPRTRTPRQAGLGSVGLAARSDVELP
jgi:hypothetical protein